MISSDPNFSEQPNPSLPMPQNAADAPVQRPQDFCMFSKTPGFETLPEALQKWTLEIASPAQILAFFERVVLVKPLWNTFRKFLFDPAYASFWDKKIQQDFSFEAFRISYARSPDILKRMKDTSFQAKVYMTFAQRSPQSSAWDLSDLTVDDPEKTWIEIFLEQDLDTLFNTLKFSLLSRRLPQNFRGPTLLDTPNFPFSLLKEGLLDEIARCSPLLLQHHHFFLSTSRLELEERSAQARRLGVTLGLASSWLDANYEHMSLFWTAFEDERLRPVLEYAKKTSLFFSESLDAAEQNLLKAETLKELFENYHFADFHENFIKNIIFLKKERQENNLKWPPTESMPHRMYTVELHRCASMKKIKKTFDLLDYLSFVFEQDWITGLKPSFLSVFFKHREDFWSRAQEFKDLKKFLIPSGFFEIKNLASMEKVLEKSEALSKIFGHYFLISSHPARDWVVKFSNTPDYLQRAQKCQHLLEPTDFLRHKKMKKAISSLKKAENLQRMFPKKDALYHYIKQPISEWFYTFSSSEALLQRLTPSVRNLLVSLDFYDQPDLASAVQCLEKAEAFQKVFARRCNYFPKNKPILSWIVEFASSQNLIAKLKPPIWSLLDSLDFSDQPDLPSAVQCLEKAEAFYRVFGDQASYYFSKNRAILSWVVEFASSETLVQRLQAPVQTFIDASGFRDQPDLASALQSLEKAEALHKVFGDHRNYFLKNKLILDWIVEFASSETTMERLQPPIRNLLNPLDFSHQPDLPSALQCLEKAEALHKVFGQQAAYYLGENRSILGWIVEFASSEAITERLQPPIRNLLDAFGFYDQLKLTSVIQCLEKAEAFYKIFGDQSSYYFSKNRAILDWIIDFTSSETLVQRLQPPIQNLLNALDFSDQPDLPSAIQCLEKAEALHKVFGNQALYRLGKNRSILDWIIDFASSEPLMERLLMGRLQPPIQNLLNALDFSDQPDLASAVQCLEKAEALPKILGDNQPPYFYYDFPKSKPILSWALEWASSEVLMKRLQPLRGILLHSLYFCDQPDLPSAVQCLEKAEALHELFGDCYYCFSKNEPILNWILLFKEHHPDHFEQAKRLGYTTCKKFGFFKAASANAAAQIIQTAADCDNSLIFCSLALLSLGSIWGSGINLKISLWASVITVAGACVGWKICEELRAKSAYEAATLGR